MTTNTTNTTKPRTKHPARTAIAGTVKAAATARREAAGAATDLAALRAHPAFRTAVDAARESFAKGDDFSGEELDQRLGITDEDTAAGEAWLDEYERRLEQTEREAGGRPEATTKG